LLYALLAVSTFETTARAAETVYFPHRDAEYLRERQHDAGAAFLTSGVEAKQKTPVLVLLHGVNMSGDLHIWFGGARRDVRQSVESVVRAGGVRPFIVAGPSQTRSASTPQTLWSKFDLGQFVQDLQHAVAGRAEIDEDAIVLAGHSGAGCNTNGGIAAYPNRENDLRPRAIVAIDPCLSSSMGSSLAQQPTNVPIWVLWQSQVWPRNVQPWRTAWFDSSSTERELRIDRIVPVGAENPHDAIVPMAIGMVARELFSVTAGNP
jgi:hypothetical protein